MVSAIVFVLFLFIEIAIYRGFGEDLPLKKISYSKQNFGGEKRQVIFLHM